MNMFFIVRKAKELKSSYAKVLRAAFSLEQVRRVLSKSGKRDRLYNPVNTWIIWLGQTLSVDHACRNALSYARSVGIVSKKASVHNGGYCQARDRLQEKALRKLGVGLGVELMKSEKVKDRWHGRRVIIPDGSSVSLPDTKANQTAYPQPKAQAVGCGFPVMYLNTLMSLTSGALLDFEPGPESEGELTRWRKMWHLLQPGDIILGDGKYPAYAYVALNRKKGKILGLKDHLVEWKRPKQLPAWTKGKNLPEKMLMRELCFRVEEPGFRCETVTIVTTLLANLGTQSLSKNIFSWYFQTCPLNILLIFLFCC